MHIWTLFDYLPHWHPAAWLLQVPSSVNDEEAVLLGDILSTAFFCAENGGVNSSSTVVVVGCGPVGLLAVMAAKHMGAKAVSEMCCCCVEAQIFVASLLMPRLALHCFAATHAN